MGRRDSSVSGAMRTLGLEASVRCQWARARLLGEQVGRGGEKTELCSAGLH